MLAKFRVLMIALLALVAVPETIFADDSAKVTALEELLKEYMDENAELKKAIAEQGASEPDVGGDVVVDEAIAPAESADATVRLELYSSEIICERAHLNDKEFGLVAKMDAQKYADEAKRRGLDCADKVVDDVNIPSDGADETVRLELYSSEIICERAHLNDKEYGLVVKMDAQKYADEAKRRGLNCVDGSKDVAVQTSYTCEDDPAYCNAQHLCEFATTRTGRITTWATDPAKIDYVSEAKSRKLACSLTFPLASCNGWNGTVNVIDGVDTTTSIMKGQVLAKDVKEFCTRDPDGITKARGGQLTVDQCVAKYLSKQNDPLRSTANCDTGELTLEWYVDGKPKTTTASFPLNVGVDPSCGSGVRPLISQFALLCPKNANSDDWIAAGQRRKVDAENQQVAEDAQAAEQKRLADEKQKKADADAKAAEQKRLADEKQKKADADANADAQAKEQKRIADEKQKTAGADEAEAKLQIESLATGLIASLPSGKKVVLKTISPEDSGLPADFLRKLTSDLEAALLVASEFEINLVNRQTTEEIWAEAMEFNNADFDALHAASGANVALMLSARATEAGVEITLTAYSLDTADAGKVLASSGSTLLALDMQLNIGVDVNSLNDQMDQVLAEIEKVGQTGGLISDPNTYAEYYHNARILQQRGEVDLAMQAYEQALAEGYLFVDPLLDLLDLSNARYGADGTKIYFDKKIKGKIPKELSDIGDVVLGGDLLTLVQPILDGDVTFSPLLAIWLSSSYINWNEMDTLTVGKTRTRAAELISKDYNSGKLQSFYVDKIRGASLGESATQIFKSMIDSGQMMVDWNKTSRTSTFFTSVGIDDHRPYMRGFDINDRVDMKQPITFCASKYGEETVCRDIDPSFNIYTNQDQYMFGFTADMVSDGTAMDWTIGMHCAVSVSYTDLNGFKVTSPVLVNHEQRKESALIDLDKVIECAGEHYRPSN